jgi:SAM-dependent methyltransferase
MPNTRSAYQLIAPQDAELAARLTLERFPRAAAYNPRWVLENQMGPNVLWLTEALTQMMDLQPGMRVLDMGCGKALSSVFLASELGVQVWATDLWIGATENWQRIGQTDVAGRVFPIHAEAHALPFAEGFFGAIVSLDAYQYFGTNDLYLDYFSRFVKPGGQIGIVVAGLQHEFPDGVPEHLTPYWQDDFCCWHSPDWWRRHWQKSNKVDVTSADFLPDGWKQWLRWGEVCLEYGYVPEMFREWVPKEIEMLRTDVGRYLGFSRVVARRKASG